MVENRRVDDGRVVQRHALYLGEINSSRRRLASSDRDFPHGSGAPRTVALFPEDRIAAVADEDSGCGFACQRSSCTGRGNGARAGWRASCGRSWGWTGFGPTACRRAARARAGIRFSKFWWPIGCSLRAASGGCIAHWFEQQAMADLLGADFRWPRAHKLYRCHGSFARAQGSVVRAPGRRWNDLFNARFEVLLYDLTSTYFESDAAQIPKATSAASATAATSAAIACRWSSRWWSRRKAFRWPTRFCPATRRTRQTLRQFP